MTRETPSFFTLDRGPSSTAAALLSPAGGRYRLLAASTAPSETDPEALLEDLAWRVARTDATIAGPLDDWRDWARLEVGTSPPATACLVAASEVTGRHLEQAFTAAGWRIAGRFASPAPDLIALGETCLRPEVDALVVGGPADPGEEEREALRLLWPRCGSLARFRDDLALVAAGPFSDRPEGIPDDRLFSLPAPAPRPGTTETELRAAARQIGAHLRASGTPVAADGHEALRASVASLATLLDGRVEAISVGEEAGSRTLAHPDREHRHAVLATGALLPRTLLDEPAALEAILRWAAVGSESTTLADRLRELCIRPWAGHDPTVARLRLAAVRVALARMQEAWTAASQAPGGPPDDDAAEVVVLTGGAFSGLPPPAAAVALVDGIRRPGAVTILHDHARVLGPLGALPVEGDRRRLLADLMDDCLLPIGSALLTGSLGERERPSGSVGIGTSLGDQEIPLEAGQLRFVDLPPGIVARIDIDPGEGSVLGVRGRRLRLEVAGGLGGLLVDTREIPLGLPDNAEQRRALLEGWEAPAWAGSDR